MLNLEDVQGTTSHSKCGGLQFLRQLAASHWLGKINL